MIDNALDNALKALANNIMRPLDLNDTESPSHLKQSFLHQRVLATYRDQLTGLENSQVSAWLVERVASLEARVMALQLALLSSRNHATSELTTSPVDSSAPAEIANTLPNRVLVLCNETVVHRGFYDVEHDIDGRAFRWMGPELTSTLFLPRVKRPFEVRLFVYAIFCEASVDLTKISIDGGEWQQSIRQGHGDNLVLVARSRDAHDGDDQHVKVDINSGVNESPQERGQDDTRRLSFAVSRIELVSIEE